MAAMASPLLEAGAIDGARGILINITGSSSLKLSEVNEASSLIQNSAHEDANIIFGAVLDETMGDDVKITVIATGFKQQEMPERRERMLAEATLPGSRYDVPVQPRVQGQRPPVNRNELRNEARTEPRTERAVEISMPPRPTSPMREASSPPPPTRDEPKFAPRVAEAPPVELTTQPAFERQTGPEVSRSSAPSELIPVPASVFDDDFFRSGGGAGRAPFEDQATERRVIVEGGEPRAWGTHDYSGGGHVQEESPRAEVFHVRAAEPVRAVEFPEPAQAQPDELDIPAFLRRGN